MAKASSELAGQCLCGTVRYTVDDEFVYALNCHCSSCRRATGSAFKPFAGIEREKLRIIEGAGDLLGFGDENAHDVHCRKCGSLLYSVVRQGAFVHVTMGTLIDSPSIRPTAHIFVGSKAPWFTITDQLPQHHEFDSCAGYARRVQ
ncbi:MAG: GFA family protein [Burkholderiaceae bacterium]